MLAAIQAVLGRPDEALGFLESAVAERCPQLVIAIRYPFFAALRTHPRFVAVLNGMGLPA